VSESAHNDILHRPGDNKGMWKAFTNVVEGA